MHGRVAQAGVTLPVAGLYPSLHLNLSECYRKLGDRGRAREHLQWAQAEIGELGDDEYARSIKGASIGWYSCWPPVTARCRRAHPAF